MRVDMFGKQENILHNMKEIKAKTGCERNSRPGKSLLDYYLANGREGNSDSSLLYTKAGAFRESPHMGPVNYCKMAENSYLFHDEGLEKEDVWLTVDEKGRKTTPYLKYNRDKVNYLVHYYLDREGDMEAYPFEGDDKETQIAYKHLVEFYAYSAIEESRLRSVLNAMGTEDAVITVDVKGDVSIETRESGNQERLETAKKKLTESGKTATAFRNMIFREGQRYKGLSGEKKNELSAMYYTGWILYRYYGIRTEDLSIQEDGSIAGLPERVYNDYEYRTDSEFYINVRRLIESGDSSEDEVGRIVYKEGNIFIL